MAKGIASQAPLKASSARKNITITNTDDGFAVVTFGQYGHDKKGQWFDSSKTEVFADEDLLGAAIFKFLGIE